MSALEPEDANDFTDLGNVSNDFNEVSQDADRIVNGDENGARRFDVRLCFNLQE
jgi:hypothetical protein